MYYGYGNQQSGYAYGGGYYPGYGCGNPGYGKCGSSNAAIVLVLFILLVIVLCMGCNIR